MKDPRNAAIALLVVLAGVLAVLLVRSRSADDPRSAASVPDRTPVTLLDVMPDRERLGHVDLLFDRPLGRKRIGDVLDPPPATIEPETGGRWRWQGANVLRFDVSGRFRAATRYEIELAPEVPVDAMHPFVGETHVHFELAARSAPGAVRLFWYQDGRLIAAGPPSESRFTPLERGHHRLVVVDDAGRSDEVHYLVE